MKPSPEWLGQPEGETLVYKRADALDVPEQIVRPVVALLNHKGGWVVVGVDDGGRPESVEDPQVACDRLRSALMDRIDPRPMMQLDVDTREVLGRQVIEVRIQAEPGQLYAEQRNGLLGFWRRVGDTVVPLTATEAKERLVPQASSGHGGGEDARHTWLSGLVNAVEGGALQLTIAFRPSGSVAIADGQGLVDSWRDLPTAQGRRPEGFGLVLNPRYCEKKAHHGGLHIIEAAGYRTLTLLRTGEVTATFGRGLLDRGSLSGRPDGDVNTWALIEGTATTCRFLAHVARAAAQTGPVAWAWLLHAPAGRRLGPHLPDSIGWQAQWNHPTTTDGSALLCAGVVVPTEVTDNPDALARTMLRQVWQRSGFDGDIPLWSETQRCFVFPAG